MRFHNKILMLIVALLLAGNLSAASSWSKDATRTGLYPGAEMLQFTGAIDSMGTLISQGFNLRHYDDFYWGTTGDTVSATKTFNSYPFPVEYQSGSVLGSPKFTVTIEGNFDYATGDAGWVPVDTLFTASTSEVLTKTTLNLNNKKFPWYRLKVEAVALSRSDATFDIRWFLYQKRR